MENMTDAMGNEIVQVVDNGTTTKGRKPNIPWVYQDKEEAAKAHTQKNAEKNGKVDYQLYQVEMGTFLYYVIGISPSDAFGKCNEQLGAKITLLSHRQPVVTVETMLASFDKFSEEQRKLILDQLLAKNPVEVKPEEPKKGKGKKS